MKRKILKQAVPRKRREKEIAALARRKDFSAALKLARGWQIDADPAQRLVDQWQAVIAAEKNPEFLGGAPSGFYEQLRQRAVSQTWTAVHRAIKENDPEFFIRVAKRLKEAPPVSDDLRKSVLSHPEMTAKEIAFEISQNVESTATQVRRLRKAWGMTSPHK